MDIKNIEVEILPDRKPEDPYNSTFDWIAYTEKCGIFPSTDSRLFRHVEFMEQTVLERLCSFNSHIFVKSGAHSARFAKIQSCVGDNILVEFLDKSSESVWIKVNDMVTDTNKFSNHLSALSEVEVKKLAILDISLFNSYKDKFNMKMNDLLQAGQFFEIQDPSQPNIIHFGEVKLNMGGIVLFKYVGIDKIASTHIIDPYCHAIGWKEIGIQKFEAKYHERYSIQDLLRCQQNPVSSLFFEKVKVKEHKMKVGTLLEVEDRGVGRGFFQGHVSAVISSHFFQVTTRSLDIEQPFTFIAHANTEGIFPVGYCEKHNYPLFPLKWSDFTENYNDEFWDKYARSYNLKDYTRSTDAQISPICSRPLISPFQFIEIYCHMRGCMYSAIITATNNRVIWVLPGQEFNTSALHCYSIGSMCVFPCGFAAKYSIPIIGEPIVPVLKSGVSDRFRLSQHYRGVPGPVFNRKKNHKERFFLPKYYLEGDNWVPTVYVKFTCYHGRFPDFSSNRAGNYPPGPMFSIIQMIAKDFYLSASDWFRQQVRELFNCSTDLPNVVVKHRWRSEHTFLRVPSCERAYQFPAWLAILLRVLGCCPNFLSLSKNVRCDGNCHSRHVMDIQMRKRGVESPGPRTLEEAKNLYSRHQAVRFNIRKINENQQFLNLLKPQSPLPIEFLYVDEEAK